MSLKIPKLVSDLSIYCDAWIVGSAADPNIDEDPRDYDVAVPYTKWQEASAFVPPDAKPNHFGGWKCISEGIEVDIFPCELAWLLTSKHNKFIWQYFHDIHYIRL